MGKKRQWNYTRAGIVPIEDVLPLIRNPDISSVVLHGQLVKVTSLRLQTFAKSITCVACGLKATHFAVESNGGYHLNLWADRSHLDRGEMLFTHDHTLARSLGGVDDSTNVTTMCAACNHKKSIGEHEEYCRRNGLPLPSLANQRRAERTETILLTRKQRLEENQKVFWVDMEYAVRQFRKREAKAAKAATA